MASKINPIILNASNYAVWVPYMESLLKSKGLWKYMKVLIPWPTKNQTKFIIDGKKNEDVGVIMTYILWEICFHLIGINYPHQFWKKLKSLFDRVYESHIIIWRKI